MENGSSYGTSWADQWDYGQDAARASNGAGGKSGKKSAALEKTKAVASTTLKKAKHGTSLGLQWIKEKYHDHKANRKH
ncbi:unnamed protein product [Spirodela intermedia]|uniref:Uncharacterized protein n=2 Tax=Spirodela intermedia TaxID=51605 RepID=A0A7I8LD00_SPIIN|nr:unnamed protein product [Spirodela intermedia]CAA6670604.1 unnamed protein product [Spirodela intermedia]CAA7407682.1 unnamed protein product [Spirodela intermedia]